MALETVGIGLALVAIAVYLYLKNKGSSAVKPAPVGNSLATSNMLDRLGIGTDAAAKALASNDPIGTALASDGI